MDPRPIASSLLTCCSFDFACVKSLAARSGRANMVEPHACKKQQKPLVIDELKRSSTVKNLDRP